MVLLLVVFMVFVCVAIILASFYFYNVAVKRSTKDFLRDNEDLKQATTPSSTGSMGGSEWLQRQSLETWQITSADGLRLVGYYLPAPETTGKTAILAHGYTSHGKQMGSFARFYHEMGYNVLMPDARGHGESGGNYIGFGWPERKDYLLWIDQVVDRVGPEAQIVLHGISMGGATVMMVSGEELTEQVKVIVEDCGYTSAYDQLAYQLKRMYWLPPFPMMPVTSLVTKLRAGYSFYEASALKQVAKSKLPMLFIHGVEDRFVPTDMVWQLYNACPAEKDLYIVEGAGHGTAYGTDRETYEKKVAEFVGRFIR
ncbi:MAG: alpha/beta hydrolase [Firmicutes bacterium]|nr:alpha/beta hydrolase [Bacillota bacterium]